MHLRLVASNGVLVDREPTFRPDFHALSRDARSILGQLLNGNVDMEWGVFVMRKEWLSEKLGISPYLVGKALDELQEQGFFTLVKESKGRRPRVWRLHHAWVNPGDADVVVRPGDIESFPGY